MAQLIMVVMAFFLLVPSVAWGETPPERAARILTGIDDMWRGDSSIAHFSMKVVTRNYTRSIQMEAWSKGTEKTLVRIVKPKKEQGTATLKSGADIYTYLSKTDRTIKLTSGMMGGSWMGSHLTNDDLVKESRLREDYETTITFEGEQEGKQLLEFTLIPKEDAAVVWGKIVLVAERSGNEENYTPRSEVFFDEEMVVARTITFSGLKKMDGRWVKTEMLIIPADKKDESTRLTYNKLTFDVPLDDDFFSLGTLRKMK